MTNSIIPTEVLFSANYSIRIFTDDNENPWFCHADICDVLGYKNSRDALSKHCKKRGVAKRDTPTESAVQSLSYINEGNLYRLIVKSKKPEAEKFEEWVFDDVLPQIRKTGSYDAGKASISAEELQKIRDAVINCTRYLKHKSASLSQTLYRQMKAELGYDKIQTMPAEQFDEAIQWITNFQSSCHELYDISNYLECEFIRRLKDQDYEDVADIPVGIAQSYQAALPEN